MKKTEEQFQVNRGSVVLERCKSYPAAVQWIQDHGDVGDRYHITKLYVVVADDDFEREEALKLLTQARMILRSAGLLDEAVSVTSAIEATEKPF